MAELTVPSKKRRALAEMLMQQQGPAPQMVGNQMAYSQNAGLGSALAKGIGGYLMGKEMAAGDGQDKVRREALSKYLMPAQPAQYGATFSGGAPELSGLAESGLPSPAVTQEARPASFDYRSAIADALLNGDTESATNYSNYAKAFADDSGEGEVKNIYDPALGKVTAALITKTGKRSNLPFALYTNPNETLEPYSGDTIRMGGTPLDLVAGYKPPTAAGEIPGKVTKVIQGETPVARKARMEEERQRKQDARQERELAIKEREAGQKDAEKRQKVGGAQANYAEGERLLTELETIIKTTPTGKLLNPRDPVSAKAKSIATQLGDIYRSKEFADLGVINPADVPRIEAVVANPTSLAGAAKGAPAQLESIKQMRQMLQSRRHLIYGDAAPAPATPARPQLRYE